MTEKRFTIVNMGLDGRFIKENGKIMTIERVVDLLNENEQLRKDQQRLYNDNIRVKQLITTAFNNERTRIGQSVLKQLIEQI